MFWGVNVAEPVVTSIGTPYRTLDADGTDIEPENSFVPPYKLANRTLVCAGKLEVNATS